MRYLAAIAASAALVSAAPAPLVARDESTWYAIGFTGRDPVNEDTYLSACHIGAGFNALCGPVPDPYYAFKINSSTYEGDSAAGTQYQLYFEQPSNGK